MDQFVRLENFKLIAPYAELFWQGMLVTILHRIEGEPQAGEHSFTDVAEDEYYADAVAWAAENDIVNGYSDTVFAPEKAMSREEMAVVLYRYAQYKGWDVSAQGDLSALG